VPSTVVAPQRSESGSIVEDIVFALKVSRPGLWATAAWFYLLPLGGRWVFHSAEFWLGLFYVTFPLGFIIYGWNDIVDHETDRFNPRKDSFLFGSRGSESQLAGLPLRIFLVQIPFAAAFMLMRGPKMLVFFVALVASTAIYNFPRYGLKSRPPFEVLNQAGYLLVFVLSSWLNSAPQLPAAAMIFGALFAMHSHIFGEIMDVVPDSKSGRRTTAVVIGVIPAKLLIITLLFVECAMVWYYFRDPAIAGFLFASAVWFILDAAIIWRDKLYTSTQMRLFLYGWNAIALGSMGSVWSTATLTWLR
jgi:4-hydroxybenzoate polyprenyltransferase